MQMPIIQVGTTPNGQIRALLLKGHNAIIPLISASDKKDIRLPHTQSKNNNPWDGYYDIYNYNPKTLG